MPRLDLAAVRVREFLGGRGPALAGALLLACAGAVEDPAAPRVATPASPSAEAPPSEPAPRPPMTFLKGQLHLHSDASGDSDTPAATVVRWYADAGFDFIVFTDHNRITEAAGDPRILVFPGVELTQNPGACDPPPAPGHQCLLHVNALFVDPRARHLLVDRPLPTSLRRVDRYRFAVDLSAALGGVALLNHPNFHYAADAALISAVAEPGPLLLEIANQAIDSNNHGDAEHPSTEAIWDAVLGAGHRVYGVATDDAHHYDDAAERRARGEAVFVGDRGFVMVHADRDPASIRAALVRGDFYASAGLRLDRVEVEGGALEIDVAADAAAPVTITFIGAGGARLAEVIGRSARFELAGARGSYVRAEVVDAGGARAWVQPVWP